jgi:hypothetical protein
LNFIFGIVCLCVCVCAFSLRRESPDMILGDKPPISEVVMSHVITLTSGNATIGLGIPPWHLVVTADMQRRTHRVVSNSWSTSSTAFPLYHRTNKISNQSLNIAMR